MYIRIYAVPVYIETNLYMYICVYVYIYMGGGGVLFNDSRLYLKGVLYVPCIKCPYVCMLYFTGDSSYIHTLPVSP